VLYRYAFGAKRQTFVIKNIFSFLTRQSRISLYTQELYTLAAYLIQLQRLKEVGMGILKRRMLVVNFVGILLFSISGVFADYIEGIDTTDVNGYGLDSAFKVTNGLITGQNIVIYHMDNDMDGYFDYSFNDIKLAAESIRCITGSPNSTSSLCTENIPYQNQIKSFCFVVKKDTDSTYSKVQILNRLANNRYVFKYGTNTSPNNPGLEKASYDRTVRYKPNNFNNIFRYGCCGYPGDPVGVNSCSWNPPLSNNNHLLGYRYYKTKPGIFIDTTAPINLTQWDSLPLTTMTSGAFVGEQAGYINLVAVYAEGISDFLKGWVKRIGFPDGAKPNAIQTEQLKNNLEIKKTPSGFCITFQSSQQISGSSSLSIYNISGIKVAEFSNIQGNQVFWKTTGQNLAPGQYIVQVELPDKRIFCGGMVYSK
jgi:hypothetical protein